MSIGGHMHASDRAHEGHRHQVCPCPGLITGSWELPTWSWELNPGPPEGQGAPLLTVCGCFCGRIAVLHNGDSARTMAPKLNVVSGPLQDGTLSLHLSEVTVVYFGR